MNKLDDIMQAFDRAADTYSALAVLQKEVAERMLQRLELMVMQPAVILDVGCGPGLLLPKLQQCYPNSQLIGVDLSHSMLFQAKQQQSTRGLCQCSMGELPFDDNSVDFIFSNLVLHWHDDIQRVLLEWRRVLKPEGLLMFSTVGPDTLKELRTAWQRVDGFQHVNEFMDMHDLGDLLLQTQFIDPVLDIEYFELLYPDVHSLLKELHGLGVKNINGKRNRGLTAKSSLATLNDAYNDFRNEKNKLPATYEIVYGHAWGPNLTGEIAIPIEHIRRRHG